MNSLLGLRSRVSGLRERALRALRPARMRFVHYSWPLSPAECPCDLDFAQWLVERGIRNQAIFHFGSGGHHWLGERNHEARLCNEVLALTLAPREHASYVRRVIRAPAFGRYYKVLFADIYTLSANCLPVFDLVSLFHLCEFRPAPAGGDRLDDAGVLRLFHSRLSPGGRMVFYRGSFAHAQQQPLIEDAVAAGLLVFVEEFRSLSIYRRATAAGAAP